MSLTAAERVTIVPGSAVISLAVTFVAVGSCVTEREAVPELEARRESPGYLAVIVTLLVDDGVYRTVQLLVSLPKEDRLHESAWNAPPAPPSLHVTVPAGDEPKTSESETFTV